MSAVEQIMERVKAGMEWEGVCGSVLHNGKITFYQK